MLDNILLLVFGITSTVALIIGVLCFWMATKHARKKGQDFRMIAWAIGGLAALVYATTSFAYFVLPILAAHLFGK